MKARPPPKAKPPSVTISINDSDFHIQSPDFFYTGPDYPTDSYRISKPHGVTPMAEISAIDFQFFRFQKATI
jgi:hypothetical protein